MNEYNIQLQKAVQPPHDGTGIPVPLSAATIEERRQKVLTAMHQRNLDQLVIYGDVEHGGNFEYLVGFFTRFEEALLVIDKSGTMTLILGNENLNKASKARISARAIHCSLFSLPNQPQRQDRSLIDLLRDAGLKTGDHTGLAGWKRFTSDRENNNKCYDLPAFITAAISTVVGADQMVNATELFIGPDGVRTTNNANEIAHYEYGAALASDCILDAMNRLEPGISEQILGDALVRNGQHTSIVTIAASGPRFINGNMFPTDNKVKVGDTISLTVGYRGGSSSRAGYAVTDETELPTGCEDYLARVAKPYFAAYVHWLKTIRIGMTGQDLYMAVDAVLPRSQYGWSLCPGHLTAEEEWLSSPIYADSREIIKSGMLFQIDIIPSVKGYGGISAESTVLLADEQLRADIKQAYPKLWQRMMERAGYMRKTLGIPLSPDVLPMCGTVGYLRPYLLDKERVLSVAEAKDPE